jgi:hypothetical protein
MTSWQELTTGLISKMIKLKSLLKVNYNLLIIILLLYISEGAKIPMELTANDLPETIGKWTRADSVQIIDATNIFDYMDGGGELYLAYRFNHLKVYEYNAKNQISILVEIYFMETPDDAFGLLSLDWGGEPLDLYPARSIQRKSTIAPSSRALYGSGLLRISADNLYIRIIASLETAESREAVLTLGRSLIKKDSNQNEPDLIRLLPDSASTGWSLRNDRIGYFRSHLVLNSLFYLSHQNILNLNHSTEAVTASYEKLMDNKENRKIQLLLIKYIEAGQAQQALAHFNKVYLPEQHKFSDPQVIFDDSFNFYQIEDGWLGYKLQEQYLVLVFMCPDVKIGINLINNIPFNKHHRE